MTRGQLPERLTSSRVVAVIRGFDPNRAVDVAHAASAGGVTVSEITMDSPNATRTIETLSLQGRDVGAGTVLSVEQAEAAVDAGAHFLVSPHTDPRIVVWAVERGVPIVPGGFSPTEIMAAWNLGASAVKVFPASVGGPALVRAVKAPLAVVTLMVTGGIDAGNIGAYMGAGASIAGIGGWLVDHEDLGVVQQRASDLMSALDEVDV